MRTKLPSAIQSKSYLLDNAFLGLLVSNEENMKMKNEIDLTLIRNVIFPVPDIFIYKEGSSISLLNVKLPCCQSLQEFIGLN